MSLITKTASQFITLWEMKTISTVAMVAETSSHWYIFTNGATQDGGPEAQVVYKVAKP